MMSSYFFFCDIMTLYVRHDEFAWETWWVHMWDMMSSCGWYDEFMCVIWRVHMCDMMTLYVRHDKFMWETWRVHMWDMMTSYVWYDVFMYVIWRVYTSDMKNSYVWHEMRQCVCTGWRRPIGYLKLQAISRKEPLIIVVFCGKWPMKIRHPMGLRHPVWEFFIPFCLRNFFGESSFEFEIGKHGVLVCVRAHMRVCLCTWRGGDGGEIGGGSEGGMT